MATQIQLRRGNATQHASFTGAVGELTFDTTNNAVRVHDGATAGGYLHVLATNGVLTNPTFTNYTETVYTANSGSAITLSLANGTIQVITLTANCVLTLPAVSAGKSFTLVLRMGTGGFSITFASGGTLYWAGNTTPTITGTANKTDIFSFTSVGGYWFGTVAGQAFNV
jgi:hypothetical protein